MSMQISDQSIAAIAAIAEHLLYPLTEMGEAGEDRFNDAADAASSAVIYSPELKRMVKRDSRFKDDFHEEKDPGDPNSVMNRLYMHQCFGLGFDFAMALTARIATDPLGDHDLKPLIDEARQRYVEMVMKRRDAYAREIALKQTPPNVQ